MQNSDSLKETAKHLEAPAQHLLQVQTLHLASQAHKPIDPKHIPHGQKLSSPNHLEHAKMLYPACLIEHHRA